MQINGIPGLKFLIGLRKELSLVHAEDIQVSALRTLVHGGPKNWHKIFICQ